MQLHSHNINLNEHRLLAFEVGSFGGGSGGEGGGSGGQAGAGIEQNDKPTETHNEPEAPSDDQEVTSILSQDFQQMEGAFGQISDHVTHEEHRAEQLWNDSNVIPATNNTPLAIETHETLVVDTLPSTTEVQLAPATTTPTLPGKTPAATPHTIPTPAAPESSDIPVEPKPAEPKDVPSAIPEPKAEREPTIPKSTETAIPQRSPQESYDRATLDLQTLKKMGFMEQSYLENRTESLGRSIEKQAKIAADRAELSALTDPKSNASDRQIHVSIYEPIRAQTAEKIQQDHQSVEEHRAYEKQMETYRNALQNIHTHPNLQAVTLTPEVIEAFDLQDDVQPLDAWNAQHPDTKPLIAGDNTNPGLNVSGNVLLPFVAKDPGTVMAKIRERVDAYRTSGKILYNKEKMLIKDADQDDIAAAVEQKLDAATLTATGEWQLEQGKEALSFLQQYAAEIRGDDFLQQEEKSWGLPMLEWHRQGQDGATIDTNQQRSELQARAQAAGADWQKLEPLLERMTSYQPSRSNAEQMQRWNDSQEFYRTFFASSTRPQIRRAQQMLADVDALPGKQGAEFTAHVQQLRQLYPELAIGPGAENMDPQGQSILSLNMLRPRAISHLDSEITHRDHREYHDLQRHIHDLEALNVRHNFHATSFQKDSVHPTRQETLKHKLQTLALQPNGSLVLNNEEMRLLTSLVQRRTTQSIRMYRNRIHDVTPEGITIVDPKRVAAVNAARMLVPYRAPVFAQQLVQWNQNRIEKPDRPAQHRQGLLSIGDGIRRQFHEHFGTTIPADLQRQLESYLEVMKQSEEAIAEPGQEQTPDPHLEKAHNILQNLVQEYERTYSNYDATKLASTFDLIAQDRFVTLAELEADAQALDPGNPQRMLIQKIIAAGKVAEKTRQPQQVDDIKITFNRHGQIGVYQDHAKDLLKSIHHDHIAIRDLHTVEIEALALARCPLTISATSLTPYQAQALRGYTGPWSALHLTNIQQISPEALQYLANQNAKQLTMHITQGETLSTDAIRALRKFIKPEQNIRISFSPGARLTDEQRGEFDLVFSRTRVQGEVPR